MELLFLKLFATIFEWHGNIPDKEKKRKIAPSCHKKKTQALH
jgi:hypothetical protein